MTDRISRRKALEALALAGAWPLAYATLGAQQAPAAPTNPHLHFGSPVPTDLVKVHPRLVLTAAGFAQKKAEIASDSVMKGMFQRLVNVLHQDYGVKHGQWVTNMAGYAFVHRLGPVAGIDYKGRPFSDWGARAVQHLQYVLDEPLDQNAGTEFWALAYDWMHPDLTSAMRTQFVSQRMAAVEGFTKHGGDPLHHFPYDYNCRRFLAGAAFAGDPEDDGRGATLLKAWDEFLVGPGGSISNHSWMGQDAGGHPSGLGYAGAGSAFTDGMAILYLAYEAHRTIYGLPKSVYTNDPDARALRRFPLAALYQTTPWPTNGARVALRTWSMRSGSTANSMPTNYCAAHVLKDADDDMAGLAAWMQQTWGFTIPTGATTERRQLVAGLLFQRPTTPRSPTQIGLPLHYKQPIYGVAVLRSSWADDATIVGFYAPKYFWGSWNYTNAFCGSFNIARKGPLVIHAGGNASLHHNPYNSEAWAGQGLIFRLKGFTPINYDPLDPDNPDNLSRDDTPESDWGGPRRMGTSSLTPMQTLKPGSDNDAGGYRREHHTATTHYEFADLTRAYPSEAVHVPSGEPRIRNWTRALIFLTNPSRILVFDRAESLTGKKWDVEKLQIINCAANPVINGTETPVSHGFWRYPGATQAVITNTLEGSNTRLFVKRLFPSANIWEKRGGPNPAGVPYGPAVDVNGVKIGAREHCTPYGQQVYKSGQAADWRRQWTGEYRLEIRPAVEQAKDRFLTLYEPTETNVTSMSPHAAIESAALFGCRFGDAIVLCAKEETQNSPTATTWTGLDSGTFVAPAGGSFTLLVADLKPSVGYNVRVGSTLLNPVTTSAGGTLERAIAPSAGQTVKVWRAGTSEPA